MYTQLTIIRKRKIWLAVNIVSQDSIGHFEFKEFRISSSSPIAHCSFQVWLRKSLRPFTKSQIAHSNDLIT